MFFKQVFHLFLISEIKYISNFADTEQYLININCKSFKEYLKELLIKTIKNLNQDFPFSKKKEINLVIFINNWEYLSKILYFDIFKLENETIYKSYIKSTIKLKDRDIFS